MARYEVCFSGTFEVEADSEDDAVTKAWDQYSDCIDAQAELIEDEDGEEEDGDD